MKSFKADISSVSPSSGAKVSLMIHLFYYQFAVSMLRSHTVIIISNRKFAWKVEYLYLQ